MDKSQYMSRLWDNASPETKDDYGKEYFDAFNSLSFGGSSHTAEVVDAMERAVLETVPKEHYRIGFGTTVLPLLVRIMPTIFESNIGVMITRRMLHLRCGVKPAKLHSKQL